MQIYNGIDIMEVSRIEDAIVRTKGFKENIFTKNEIENIDVTKSQIKYQRYAGRFAAKEAIFKAMSKILVDSGLSMSFLDIEIENIRDLKNRPRVNILNTKILELVVKKGIKIDISISHIKETATAVAVVVVN